MQPDIEVLPFQERTAREWARDVAALRGDSLQVVDLRVLDLPDGDKLPVVVVDGRHSELILKARRWAEQPDGNGTYSVRWRFLPATGPGARSRVFMAVDLREAIGRAFVVAFRLEARFLDAVADAASIAVASERCRTFADVARFAFAFPVEEAAELRRMLEQSRAWQREEGGI